MGVSPRWGLTWKLTKFEPYLGALHKSVSLHFFGKMAIVGIQISKYCLDGRITSYIPGVEIWSTDLDGHGLDNLHSASFVLTWISCANWRFIEQADYDYENECLFAEVSISGNTSRQDRREERTKLMREFVHHSSYTFSPRLFRVSYVREC